ncbi:MAG: Tex family protein [bacterium]
MSESHHHAIAAELGVAPRQVAAVAALLDEGATVPFISRYRKEATGSLDEVAITAIRDRREQLADLDKRREAILKSLSERELLTDELRRSIAAAGTLAVLEDLYLPYRPKRKTRASVARERGLEPLAAWLLEEAALPAHQAGRGDPAERAAAFVDPDKEVPTAADALAGARDIIAEIVNEDAAARESMRTLFRNEGEVRSRLLRGKEQEGAKFRDYFEFSEPVRRIAGHRVLAIRRGEQEKILAMTVEPAAERAVALLQPRWVKNQGSAAWQVAEAVADGYRRLLSVAMETELRLELKNAADAEAIGVFAANLRELLLAPPLGGRRVLALDPGFRTGCKLVVLDAKGDLLHNDTIYPHSGAGGAGEAAARIRTLVERHQVEAVAIGNGTAGRETETFVRGLGLPPAVVVIMVNESGASVYSASEAARAEFPDHDLTVRGAVSIGRRLMDPLAELVKIDPKSIGVGQYQHDVDQKALKRSLDDTVMSCVNAVGVEVNTASAQLLAYVSGLGPQLAGNITAYRAENGPFRSRRDLLKVPRLGPKAFEQAAGFLRIRDGKNPLDGSAVHPERYGLVAAMAERAGLALPALIGNEKAARALPLAEFVSDEVGLPTLQDIVDELCKPGRDPRREFEIFSFAAGIDKIEDLEPGMRLPGIVTNVTNFGAFIDVGVHQDGLAHISQLADRFVRDPNEVVKVGQKVEAKVLEVDLPRRRISLTLKES